MSFVLELEESPGVMSLVLEVEARWRVVEKARMPGATFC